MSLLPRLATSIQTAMSRRPGKARSGKMATLATLGVALLASAVWATSLWRETQLALNNPDEAQRQPFIEHQGYTIRAEKLVEARLLDLRKLQVMRRKLEQGTVKLPVLLSDPASKNPKPAEQAAAELAAEAFMAEAGVNEAAIRSAGQWVFYAQRSPLRADILAYLRDGEEGEQQTFRLTGAQLLDLDPNARKTATPFHTRYAWTGQLRYMNRAAPPATTGSATERPWELRVWRNGVESSSHRLIPQRTAPAGSQNHESPLSMGVLDPSAHSRVRLTGSATGAGRDRGLVDAWIGAGAGCGMRLNLVIVDNNRVGLPSSSGIHRTPGGRTGDYCLDLPTTAPGLLLLTPTGVAGQGTEDVRLDLLSPQEALARPFVGKGGGLGDTVISSFHYVNGKPQRMRGEGIAKDRSRAWLGMLDTALGDLMATGETARKKADLPPNPAVSSQDFLITIDPRLQGPLQNFLAATPPQEEWLVTVMNESGEILALADQPRRMRPKAGGGMEPVGTPDNDYQKLTNNFKPHHVGSSGKPYLSAAAMAAHPALAGLWLPQQPGKKAEALLGYDLGKPTETLHQGVEFFRQPTTLAETRTALRYAFAKSSDTFFMGQMVLALGLEGGRTVPEFDHVPLTDASQQFVLPVRGASGWTLQRFKQRPRIAGAEAVGSDIRLDHPIGETEFGRALEGIFDVRSRLDAGFRANHAPEEVYTELFSFFQKPLGEDPAVPRATEERLRHFLSGVSPEHSRLLFIQDMQLRQDFLNVVLGGGDFGRWTNVELARCMTRLVTGRQVEARLVRLAPELGVEPGPPVLAPPIPELQQPSIYDGLTLGQLMIECVRAPLNNAHGGLEGTARSLGDTWLALTGKDNGKDKPKTATYDVFAKTGSFPNQEVEFGSYSMVTFHVKAKEQPGRRTPPGITVVISGRGGRNFIGEHSSPAAVLSSRSDFLSVFRNYLALLASAQ